MFGIFRTALAVLVVLQHLAKFPFVGSAAVMAFFILSGYLMTYVMQRSYGYDAGGVARFCTNRFLRLFPSYWVALLISIAIIVAIGVDVATAYRTPLGIPGDIGGWIANITMIYPAAFPTSVQPRIAPATWALTVELVFYALIALGISRNRLLTWIWFVAAVAWHVYVGTEGLDREWQYGFVGAGALPFSIGALIYHYHDELTRRLPGPGVLLLTGVVIFAGAFACVIASMVHDSEALYDLGFYANLGAQAIVVLAFSNVDMPRWRKLDEVVGDWSYHIYILHWATGALWAVSVFGQTEPGRNITSLAVVVLATLTAIAISLLLTRFVDKPIRTIRQRLRNRQEIAAP